MNLAIILTIFVLVISFPIYKVFACEKGSGNIIQKDFSFNSFDAIVLEGSGIVYLSQGSDDKIKVETDDNIMPLMKIRKKDDILFIGTSKSICTRTLKIYVTAKNISKIGISGSGDIIGQTPFKNRALRIRIEGSGDVKLKDLDLEFFSAIITGSGDLRLEGRTDQSKYKISGSGDIYAYDFISKDCEITIAGSGDVQVNVSDNLNVSITGSGDVLYKGQPKNIIEKIFGSGDIRAVK